MVADILCSFEIISKFSGRKFRTHHDIVGDAPLTIPSEIEFTFADGRTQRSSKSLAPDALFSIDTTYFAIEADRMHEPLRRSTLNQTSYLRKFLQYRDVLLKRTYQSQWAIPSLLVLNITINGEHCRNMIALRRELGDTSRSMLFKAIPSLGSFERAPRPLLYLLEEPWERVGHAPLVLSKTMNGGDV
jgi:hypothetical protein